MCCDVVTSSSVQSVGVGYASGVVRVFDIHDSRLRYEVSPHRSQVRVLALTPTGDCAVSGDNTGCVTFTHLPTGVARRVLRDPDGSALSSLSLSRGRHGASALLAYRYQDFLLYVVLPNHHLLMSRSCVYRQHREWTLQCLEVRQMRFSL